MGPDLYELLFEGRWGQDRQPLFRSQADLAKAVTAAGFGSPDRSDASVRAFLSQVLQGKRRASPNLHKAIELAAEKRLTSENDTSTFQNVLATAVRAQRSRDSADLPLDAKKEFDALTREGEQASDVFIATFEPAELQPGSTKAAILRGTLIERLNISKRLEPPLCRYTFNFPDESTAFHFWARFTDDVLTQMGPAPGIQALQEMDALPLAPLRVFTLAPVLCINPYVIYDPESASRSGFVLHYHETNRVSVARMSPTSLFLWYQHLFRPLEIEAESDTFSRKRIRWSTSPASRRTVQ